LGYYFAFNRDAVGDFRRDLDHALEQPARVVASVKGWVGGGAARPTFNFGYNRVINPSVNLTKLLF
jgi:hypothetical protein